MGDFMDKDEGTFAVGSLNDLFGPANIATTFATVEQLRVTFPHLFNPANNPGPKNVRKQTLRFAGFLITDQILFDGLYPAPRFRKWLKWLTWLDTVQGGTLTLNGAAFNGSAGQLVLQVLKQALPPGGQPSPVRFDWTHNSSIANFAVEATTNAGGYTVGLVSPDHSEVNTNSDDEDDINP